MIENKHYTLKQDNNVVLSSDDLSEIVEYLRGWIRNEAFKLYPPDYVLEQVFTLAESFQFKGKEYKIFDFTISKI